MGGGESEALVVVHSEISPRATKRVGYPAKTAHRRGHIGISCTCDVGCGRSLILSRAVIGAWVGMQRHRGRSRDVR